MEDYESCGSGATPPPAATAVAPPPHSRQKRQKLDVYNEVLRRLKDINNDEANQLGFDDQLWAHFHRLPARYALDVNVERAEDVLMHMRLLHLARNPDNRPVIEVRLVQIGGDILVKRKLKYNLENLEREGVVSFTITLQQLAT